MKAIHFTLLLSILTSLHSSAQLFHNSPQQLYESAFDLYQAHKHLPALVQLNQAIAKQKDFTKAYLLRAEIKEMMGDEQGTQTDYSIVLHIDPYLTEARFGRGRVYYRMHRYKDALADFHSLVHLPKNETSVVYFKGKTDNTGFSANGITTLQSDIKAELFNYIGLAHLSLKNLDSATFYIRQAIERSPAEADFYVNAGLIQEQRMDALSAIEEYHKALSFQPDHAAALSNLSKLSKDNMYNPLIFQSYNFAVEDRGSYQAYFNRGIMLQSEGKHLLAIEDFNNALELAGNDAEIFLMRAFSKEASEDLEGAIKDYNHALKQDPTLEKAYTNRGNVYYKLKEYNKAIQDFNAAIGLNSENTKLYYNRGLALYLAGNAEKGCLDLHRALNMDYSSAKAPIEAYCAPTSVEEENEH